MFVSVGTVRQALTILPAGLCELSYGIGYGWTAPSIKQLKNNESEFSLTTEQCSWIASLPESFRAVGTTLVFLIADVIGRRKLYFLCLTLFAISWSMMLAHRSSVWMLYGGRSVFGLAMGINDAVSLLYLAENSSPRLRGVFASLYITFYYVGTLTAYVLSVHLSYTAVALVNLSLQFFLMAFTTLVKESAQFFIMKGRYGEAEKVFFWLRATKSAEAKREYEDMVKNIPRSLGNVSPVRILSSKANCRSLRMVFLLTLLTTLTGYRTVLVFVTTIFSQSIAASAEYLTILCGLLVLAGTAMSSLFIEYVNRRTMLVIGWLGGSALQLAIAVLYYWHENIFQLPYFGWIVFSGILVCIFLWSLIVAPICYVLSGELLVQHVRPFGSFLSVSTNALGTFVLSLAFLRVAEAYGIYLNFLFFSAVTLTTLVYVCACIPETRGKSLIEIQKMLEN